MTSKQPAHLLPDSELQAYEDHASSSAIPQNKLPEIIHQRAVIRALLGHIRAVEELLAKEVPTV